MKLLTFLVITLLFQPSFANSSFTSTKSETNGNAYLPHPKVKTEKLSLKQRLLLKFAERKLQKQANEDKQKKTVKLLGSLSLLSAIVGIISWALLFIVSWASTQFLVIMIFLLFPLAVILGITSLLKRKKLANKKEVSKIPALLGVILGGAGVLLILIGIIAFLSSFVF